MKKQFINHISIEPINKYHNISFTDIKDFTADEEYFIDILLVNKNRHRITINTGLISFINRNITFKKQDNEIYQTNSIDILTALYHLIYESEHDISEILSIQENETIEQVATFEKKNQTLNSNLILTNIPNKKKNLYKSLIFNIHT